MTKTAERTTMATEPSVKIPAYFGGCNSPLSQHVAHFVSREDQAGRTARIARERGPLPPGAKCKTHQWLTLRASDIFGASAPWGGTLILGTKRRQF